ncbi:MAG: hypothetical protein KC469_00785 [Flavobacteriaceae bacterium]|nr:hypothetical protein [Flavobacteriaceae bacterium]
MQIIKQILDFYINASIHVALAVCSLCWITNLEFGLTTDWALLCFVFFAAVTGYNFVKYFGLAKFHHRQLSPWLRFIQIFSMFCFMSLLYFGFQLNNQVMWLLLGLGVITFLYAVPLLPTSWFVDKGKNLRSISGLKVYIIALVWAIVVVILPVINADMVISSDVVITGIQRYIFVLVLMLPFEIRDLQYDSLKLATIPQRIGVLATKIIGSILIFAILLMEFFKDEINSHFILSFVLLVLLGFVWFSKIKQPKYYSSFWVEGMPILWLILYLL